jgi:hypothetical protein
MAQKNAQPQQREPVKTELSGDGSEFFRALLHVKGIKPVTELELSTLQNLNDVIVIVLGNPNIRQASINARGQQTWVVENQQAIISKAMRTGGAILVASSDAYRIPVDGTNSGIAGSPVRCSKPEFMLRGKLDDCPLVIPTHRPQLGNWLLNGEEQKLFNGDGNELKALQRVAAGAPSYINSEKNQFGRSPLNPLAYFPPDCSKRANSQKEPEILGRETPFAVGGELMDQESFRQFRFLVFASNKIFNNALLYLAAAEKSEDQTDNMELCFRTIDYLQGPNQQRKKCVFFENGRLIEHFDDLARATTRQMPLPSINMGALQKDLIDKGNSLIDGLQKDDAPNRLANKLLPLKSLALILLWAISISACLFMFRKLVRSRKPSNTPPAPTIAGATSNPPGVFERRQKELLRRNNVYETVRDLVREFFASVGIQGEPGARLPKIRVSRVVRKPDSLRLAIKDLWRLAYGQPQAVSVAQWRDLEPYFERVRQAHEDGKWTFAYETVS